ncbi:hypothetical protein GH714_021018 [Hevea brasiliensis]|uniref:PGG domain-containing protein n=1 Tax=Hevea brasiliensis TaxID=3981 RepID=A0A6A6LQG4_HEVBR|nr:hypothetical protein GH714_021018 [Hevea brasiliensis]
MQETEASSGKMSSDERTENEGIQEERDVSIAGEKRVMQEIGRDVIVAEMSVPYQAFLDGDWERLKSFFEQNTEAVVSPLTVNKDTVLHIAIYSGRNEYGNTALHEAAAAGNVTAAKLLLDYERTLLDIKNKLGETPLYRAAAFGKTEMVKFLVSEVLSYREEILSTHRQKGPSVMSFHGRRYDSTSILHIAVQAEHFETALYLQRADEALGQLKDESGRTCLHLLAGMLSAYRSNQSMGKLKGFLYRCLPDDNEYEEDHQDTVSFSKKHDMESGTTTNHFLPFAYPRFRKGWPALDRIWKERKRRHESVMKLTKLLVRLDKSWETSLVEPDIGTISLGKAERFRPTTQGRGHSSLEDDKEDTIDNPVKKTIDPISTPLLIASSTGIIEIVDEMLKAYPYAVSHVSECKEDNPFYYIMHHNNDDKTAFELFEKTHAKLHKEAQGWLKRTSESCSVIAVLIATVGFTAIYTVPGGTDEKTGLPVLLHYPFFVVFTVLDIISLASSLTSVVMFLSILTSPFRLQDFLISLPRKLTLGFTFLFISVAATMLAFAAAIVLEIHLKEQWSRSLIYTVAFLPVTAFAILQFPLYFAFAGIIKSSLKALRKALPWSFILCLYRNTKLSIRKMVH